VKRRQERFGEEETGPDVIGVVVGADMFASHADAAGLSPKVSIAAIASYCFGLLSCICCAGFWSYGQFAPSLPEAQQ
jgi:hypothetical protein